MKPVCAAGLLLGFTGVSAFIPAFPSKGVMTPLTSSKAASIFIRFAAGDLDKERQETAKEARQAWQGAIGEAFNNTASAVKNTVDDVLGNAGDNAGKAFGEAKSSVSHNEDFAKSSQNLIDQGLEQAQKFRQNFKENAGPSGVPQATKTGVAGLDPSKSSEDSKVGGKSLDEWDDEAAPRSFQGDGLDGKY